MLVLTKLLIKGSVYFLKSEVQGKRRNGVRNWKMVCVSFFVVVCVVFNGNNVLVIHTMSMNERRIRKVRKLIAN